jgi:uncharacterized membrane protein
MSPDSLLSADDPLLIWAFMTGLTAISLWLDRTPFGKKLPGVVFCMGVTIILANLDVVPKSSATYDTVFQFLLPVAIPMLLFKADLRRVIPEARGMLIIFVFGAIGSMLGAVLGYLALSLGSNGAALASAMAASYIGGSMNLAAVGDSLGITSEDMVLAVAADNVIGSAYLISLAMLHAIPFVRRRFPSRQSASDTNSETDDPCLAQQPATLQFSHLSFALSLSLIIVYTANATASAIGMGELSILFSTLFALLLANLFPRVMARLQGDFELGTVIMFFFFIAVGAGADIQAMIDTGLSAALLVTSIILCHALMVGIGGRLFRIEFGEMIIASSACAGGPPTAAALAAARGWKDLVAPAVSLGVLGYAVANMSGIGLAYFLRSLA